MYNENDNVFEENIIPNEEPKVVEEPVPEVIEEPEVEEPTGETGEQLSLFDNE